MTVDAEAQPVLLNLLFETRLHYEVTNPCESRLWTSEERMSALKMLPENGGDDSELAAHLARMGWKIDEAVEYIRHVPKQMIDKECIGCGIQLLRPGESMSCNFGIRNPCGAGPYHWECWLEHVERDHPRAIHVENQAVAMKEFTATRDEDEQEGKRNRGAGGAGSGEQSAAAN